MNYSPVFVVDQEAIEIGDLYRRGRASVVESVRCLVEAGRRLAAKKDDLPHGAWLPWLAANADALGFDRPRTAQMLIRGASNAKPASHLTEADATAISRQIWGHSPARGTAFSGNYEWYTPAEYVEHARCVLGTIDLDPASSAPAQEIVKAKRYFSADDDGLRQEWCGRIWLNPPYAQPTIEQFIDKLIEETEAARATGAILLTHNSTDTAWFHKAASAASAICFTRGRIAFIDTTGQRDAPTQGQAFFYFGKDPQAFATEFSPVGFVAGALR